jgi:hypothetical protein
MGGHKGVTKAQQRVPGVVGNTPELEPAYVDTLVHRVHVGCFHVDAVLYGLLSLLGCQMVSTAVIVSGVPGARRSLSFPGVVPRCACGKVWYLDRVDILFAVDSLCLVQGTIHCSAT